MLAALFFIALLQNTATLVIGGLRHDDASDLIAFLQALTDEPLLADPRFANPWKETR